MAAGASGLATHPVLILAEVESNTRLEHAQTLRKSVGGVKKKGVTVKHETDWLKMGSIRTAIKRAQLPPAC